MPKDTEKATEWLREYRQLLERFDGADSQNLRVLLAEVQRREPLIQTVVGDLVPDRIWMSAGGHPNWLQGQRASLERASGVLRDRQELRDHWSTDAVIEIDADALHPWVWTAAKGVWGSEHWGEAVEAAVKVLQVKLQEKLGRVDLSGTKLATEAFRLDEPAAGEARLRVRENDGSDTYKSMQQGVMFLGQAVFSLWRNPLSHEPGGATRQEAIEALAAASTLARLIESSVVVTGE